MSKVIGIDLGTTNSCVSHLLAGKSEVIANAEGKRTTPSVVYIKGDELIVGELAKRKAIIEPKNVIYEVKRFMGMKYKDVEKEAKAMPYDTKEGKDGGVLIVVDGKEYKPEQISSFVLKKLKEDAEKFLGTKVTQAVITVPAYFNDSQRNATKVAGEIAGLKVERIINEPTAASLSYGEDKKKDEKVLVFDLGGGTFDVTILEIGAEGTFQVLSTSGDTHLGGKDFDTEIIDYLINDFKMKEGIDLSKIPMAKQRLKDEAENAKIQLSQREMVDVSIPFITLDKNGTPKNLEAKISRPQFEKMVGKLIDRCKVPMKNAIKDAKISFKDIDTILLVGGSSRMTWVKDMIKEISGKEAKATVNPDEAVAEGAAIQGGIIQGDVKDILLLDVTPLSLGVEVEGSLVNVMIPRNTTIPAKKSGTYTNAADNQPEVTIHILQGERQFAKDNKSLGMFNLSGIPPMKRGQAQIEVIFDIDANGLLHVSAKENTTGKEQKITVKGAVGISDEEITKAKADAEKFAEEDKKKREIIEIKNKLETTIYQLENELDGLNDNELKNNVKHEIEKAKEFKSNENVSKDDIEEQQKKLEELVRKVYEAKNNNSNNNQNNNESNNSVEGEVIEG